MSYKVLYRKYRPNSFNEVVGQEATVKILKNSIINEKISHAYLFSGPRGTGKTSMARIFAKAINCENSIDGEACGKCVHCLNFNSSPDIIEIDAASNNGVDEIRELINNVKLMPSSSKYKVYIIDEVHMLSQSAFNALLLTLEEPPNHIIFILATTNIESVPITILSRCQKYEFFKISDDLIKEHLKHICEKENIDYDIEGLKEITTLADGGLRDALSILDQLSKEKEKINLDLVIRELGSISLVKIKELIKVIDNNDTEKALNIIEELKKTNLNYKVVIKKIIEVLSYKSALILKDGQEGYLTYSKIKRIILELNDSLNKININVNPYIILQMILLDGMEYNKNINVKEEKIIEEPPKKDIQEEPKEEQEIKEKKNEKLSTKTENKKEINYQKLKEIRVNNCFVGADKNILTMVKNNWVEFLEKQDAPLKGLLADVNPVAASNQDVILATSITHQSEEINENIENIAKEFKKIFNSEYKFICLSDEEWQKARNDYIKNINSGYKYEIQSEEIEKSNNSELEKIANDLFAQDKIEIK